VIIHPWSDDVIEQMAAHDLFVLLSSAEEMFCADLEAAAAGIRVVVTDVPGNPGALMGERPARWSGRPMSRSWSAPSETALQIPRPRSHAGWRRSGCTSVTTCDSRCAEPPPCGGTDLYRCSTGQELSGKKDDKQAIGLFQLLAVER
jgi:hypothetical protein